MKPAAIALASVLLAEAFAQGESVVLGEFEADVATVSALDREVDVLWVTVKATRLGPALELYRLSPAQRPEAADARVRGRRPLPLEGLGSAGKAKRATLAAR